MIRIHELPTSTMVSSGIGKLGDAHIQQFDEWVASLPRSFYPKDFLAFQLFRNEDTFFWLYVYEEDLVVPSEFELLTVTGGLYAVISDVDEEQNREIREESLHTFLEGSFFELDEERFELVANITPTQVANALGYRQLDVYYPIKWKQQHA